MATLDPIALAALPVGTSNAQAFSRNASDIDTFVNGVGIVQSRTGKSLLSLDEALIRIGYETPVAFASGIVVTRATQTIIRSGLTYHANPASLPFTTTGTFLAGQWALVSNITAQDLASSAAGKGADLVAVGGTNVGYVLATGVVRNVANVAEIRAIDKTKTTRAQTLGYWAAGDGAPNLYYYDSADTTSSDNGGTIVVGADGGRWKLVSPIAQITARDFGAKGDFNPVAGTGSDDRTAFQRCLAATNTLRIPAGLYIVSSGPVSISTTGSVLIEGAGMGATVVYRQGDGDLFTLTNTGGGAQVTVRDLTMSPRTNMTSGTALYVTMSAGNIPSLVMERVSITSSASPRYEFKYGVWAVGCKEARFDKVFVYGVDETKMSGFVVASPNTTSALKWTGCAVYNAVVGIDVVSSTSPGIEGVQVMHCDLVGVQYGVRAVNSFGTGYFPPQISVIGGHINASVRCVYAKTYSQVIISSALLYCSGTTGSVLMLEDCSGLNISGNQMYALDSSSGVEMIVLSLSTLVDFGIISGNCFFMGGTSKPALYISHGTRLQNGIYTGNMRKGGGAALGVGSGTLPASVSVTNNL